MFSQKVLELNRQYEVNNNGEADNGVAIATPESIVTGKVFVKPKAPLDLLVKRAEI